MRLKDYQGETLDTLDAYVAEIVRARATEETTRAAFAAAALDPAMLATMLATLDPPVVAWTAAQAMGRTASPDPWRPLPDGHGRQVPHVCLNLPTGSGKTLIAGHAVGRILTGLDAAMTGFVLWVVPSDAIYRQTLGQLRDKGSPLRQALETASGGRVRIIEKMDDVVRADVDAGLTVMLLMLQGARVRKAESLTKEDLKIFRESGNYATFFPDADDRTALAALRRAVPNLDGDDLGDATGRPGVGVRQSLANTLRIVRPLIVLDEGHNAYSPERRAVLAGFNPRFLLELTATPDRELSNVLVKIGGLRLRDEQMIKLPIELEATDKAVWRDTLKAALDRRAALEVDAAALHARTGRFIRPILLVRVERVGRDQREAGLVHAEDVYEALTQTMGVPPEWVRRQTSVDKELDGREGSETSDVRIIITKDALKEGWDCPSAYVLALLSRTQAKTALTQMIGRVLRQPEAKRTHVDALDSAWVFCCDIGVGEAVEGIRAGLDRDGMGDLRASVRTAGATATTRTVERRPALRGRRLLVPRVTHGDGRGGWAAARLRRRYPRRHRLDGTDVRRGRDDPSRRSGRGTPTGNDRLPGRRPVRPAAGDRHRSNRSAGRPARSGAPAARRDPQSVGRHASGRHRVGCPARAGTRRRDDRARPARADRQHARGTGGARRRIGARGVRRQAGQRRDRLHVARRRE